MNRSVPLNGRRASLFSEGARFQAHRPVAPQRHRERMDHWSAPDDGPSWPQEWTAWLAMTATALGILGLAYVAAVLAFVAGR